MPAIKQSACGKVILLGEHAVVYDQPALAMPVSSRRVKAWIEPRILAPSGQIWVKSPFLGLDQDSLSLPELHPVFQAIHLTLAELQVQQRPSCILHLSSDLPVSSGLGSSASIAVATIRSMSAFLGHSLDTESVNRIAFECEKLVHGQPSGIDNTIVSYEKPVFFHKDKPIEFVNPTASIYFVLADSKIRKSTKETVATLAENLKADFEQIMPKLEAIGGLALAGRDALTEGNLEKLAQAMKQNQSILKSLGLSCPELDSLTKTAMEAGALAAKLTGGGKGGHIVALVEEDKVSEVLLTLEEKHPQSNPFITKLEREDNNEG